MNDSIVPIVMSALPPIRIQIRRRACRWSCARRVGRNGVTCDILPALKDEDSSVGRGAVRRCPEGNFLPRREYRVRAQYVGPVGVW